MPSTPKPAPESRVPGAAAVARASHGPYTMSKELRTAQVCGRAPLATGVGIFVVYIVALGVSPAPLEGWAGLVIPTMMLSGFALLIVGPMFFCLGAWALATHVRRGVSTPGGRQPAPPGPSVAAAAVLLSNFVVAHLILQFVAGDWNATETEYRRRIDDDPYPWTYTVLIQNISEEDLSGARIVGCGPRIEIGSLEAGASKKYSVSIEEACTIQFAAEGPKANYVVVVDELNRWSRNSWTTLTLHPGGECSLQSQKTW